MLGNVALCIQYTAHSVGDLFKPELAVPTRMGCTASRSHCALRMLGNRFITFTYYLFISPVTDRYHFVWHIHVTRVRVCASVCPVVTFLVC